MQKIVFLSALIVVGARVGMAQVAGSAGGFGGNASGNAGTSAVYGSNGDPAQNERNKRRDYNDGASTFIDGSILMNVKADEYVAVFGVMEEGKTPEEANEKMDATIASFKTSLRDFAIKDDDIFVDFVAQNRIYEYRIEGKLVIEELAGFELKKNVSIHFKDKLLVDKLAVAAARFQIFDLIKVDYLVKDMAAIQARLQAQTMGIIKRKVESYQNLLGIKSLDATQIVADKPSVYFPIEQYSSYVAAESQNVSVRFGDAVGIRKEARKSRTTYFKPLSGDSFDTVINPVIIEPVVQFTTYIKVKYETPEGRKRANQTAAQRRYGGFGGY